MSDREEGQLNPIPPIRGGAADVTAAAPKGHSTRRLVLLGTLALLVLSALALDLYYIMTKKPLTEMVPPAVVVAKTVPPTYVTSLYGVNKPMGVAASPDAQRVYVSESAGERLIRAFDRSGKELFSITPPGSTAGDRGPVYMAVDGKGQLYVADPARGRVSVYNQEGHFVSDVQPPDAAAFSSPLGVAFDRGGNLLIADTTANNHSVIVLDPESNLVRRLGKSGSGSGELNFPNQAASDSRGRVYVSNGNSGRVDVFGQDGQYLGPLASGNAKGAVGLPRGVAVDNLDRLYTVDSVGSTVHVFDVAGDKPAFLYSIGSPGEGDGQLLYPIGIAVDATGRVYLADRANSRVQVWSY